MLLSTAADIQPGVVICSRSRLKNVVTGLPAWTIYYEIMQIVDRRVVQCRWFGDRQGIGLVARSTLIGRTPLRYCTVYNVNWTNDDHEALMKFLKDAHE